jgi:hypothetical protein
MLIVAVAEARSDRDLMTWWGNGGEQTLDSYGVNDPSSLPAPHLEWIKTLPLMFADQKRLFVHAGIRPGIAISDNDMVLFDHRQRKVGRRPIDPMAPDLKEVPARSSPC